MRTRLLLSLTVKNVYSWSSECLEMRALMSSLVMSAPVTSALVTSALFMSTYDVSNLRHHLKAAIVMSTLFNISTFNVIS